MIHFSRSPARITAAGSEGGGVVTMRSLGEVLEAAILKRNQKKKKKKKKKEEEKREDGRWEKGTQGVLAARNPKSVLLPAPGTLPPRYDARQLLEPPYQLPPRNTRREPLIGPVGSNAGLSE